jgi:hypothetical protein
MHHPKTVGELRALLADEPDDMPILTRGGMGGCYASLEVAKAELVTVGKGEDSLTVHTSDPVFKTWKGKKGKPFVAVIFP